MKKIAVVFFMVLFIYATMSIFSSEVNPLLWINQHNVINDWVLYVFIVEVMLFCLICCLLYTYE